MADVGNPEKKPSKLWYLLPIFLNIIGGVIGYFILKDRDRKFAERLLIIGLVMIVVWWGLSFVLAGLAYLYIGGVFEARTQGIETIDVYCTEGSPDTATITIRNIGTDIITLSEISTTETAPTAQPVIINWRATTLGTGGIATGTVTCDGSGSRTCSYRLTPPMGPSINVAVYCR